MRLSYYAYEGQGAIHEIELKNYFGTKTTKNPSFAKMVSHLKVPMPFLSLFFNVVAFDQDIISMCYGLVGQVQIRSVAVTPTTVSIVQHLLTTFLVVDAHGLPDHRSENMFYRSLSDSLRLSTNSDEKLKKMFQTGAEAILCLGNTDADAPYWKFF
jgi:hypothetical protein